VPRLWASVSRREHGKSGLFKTQRHFEHFSTTIAAYHAHSNPRVVMRVDTLLLRLPIIGTTLGLVAVCVFQRWLALKLNREAAERRAFCVSLL
jgi:hypothetical protein